MKRGFNVGTVASPTAQFQPTAKNWRHLTGHAILMHVYRATEWRKIAAGRCTAAIASASSSEAHSRRIVAATIRAGTPAGDW
jgi:hypothetical protein